MPPATPAHIATKLSSMRSPFSDDFSGWNWTPNTDPRPTTVANRSPYSARADDVVVIGRARGERVHVVEGAAAVREAREQRRGALEPDLVPADVRDPQSAGVAAA